MLVMTRGIDESIVIGDGIVVTVLRVNGGVVRIGISAPAEALIMRAEMLEDEARAKNSAALPDDQ
jgi:carbon storage regulator CsrA